ncbi:type VI secretion system-associated protein VasI [Pseudomonas aeruginosa]|nr:type VI secretion system-associated protein VasI [Pseudomonas aeruginosa]
MKSLSLALALAALATGCDAGKPVDATSEVDVATAPITECTHIVSAVERLSCFDAAAGTPPAPVTPAASALSMTAAGAHEAAARKPEIVGLVGANESMRQPGETEFRISREPDEVPGQWRVVISAPASGGRSEAPVLAISCLSNISRLQLIAKEPVGPNRMNIRLYLDGKPLSPEIPWQVLEDGTVIDAGRGLVAIEQLRGLVGAGSRLRMESDYAAFADLAFDATGLHALMRQQREACHW